MTPSDIANHISKLRIRSKELETALSDPAVFNDMTLFRRSSQELSKLSALFEDFDRWVNALETIDSDRELLTVETDAEMRTLLEEEISSLAAETAVLESRVQLSLLPPDPNDAKNIIVGIKPAAGGDEAALFAGELFRAYLYFAESQGWKVEILEQSEKETSFIPPRSVSLCSSISTFQP